MIDKEHKIMSLYGIEDELINERKKKEHKISMFSQLVDELAQKTSYEDAVLIALDTINKE